jgi:multidrug resistance efflux pump
MLNKFLLRFVFVRELQADLEASKQHCRALASGQDELEATIADLEDKIGTLEHSLDIERTKRIAAEQIAVSRGEELDWLRGEFDKAQQSRDAAVSERVQSLDLVNVTLLKHTEAEAAPTKEQMADWKPIDKRMKQGIPMLRQAQHALVRGLQNKSRLAIKATPKENVQ